LRQRYLYFDFHSGFDPESRGPKNTGCTRSLRSLRLPSVALLEFTPYTERGRSDGSGNNGKKLWTHYAEKGDEENIMANEETFLKGDFARCVEFHGHTCPGLAIGFQAAKTLMKRLGVRKAPDEELLAIVETDACGVDAIQVMTGCTFGKGNFIFKNYGKHAFSLMDRGRQKRIRVCLLPDVFGSDPEYSSLSKKVQRDEASAKEIERFRQLQQDRVRRILEAEPESLFKIEEISADLPPKARIVESGVCDICGEPTKVDVLRKIRSKKICVPCAERRKI
jgi:formylmethanofuran dehydrogenase subunit E